MVCPRSIAILIRHTGSGRPLFSALLLTELRLLFPCCPEVLMPPRHMTLSLIAVGGNSRRGLTAPRAAGGAKWSGTRQQGRIFHTRPGRRRRPSHASQGTRRPAAYRTSQQTRSHISIPRISKQSWPQRNDQNQPRYLLCPTCRGRSRKRRTGGNGKKSHHAEIKRFFMSKVYIIIIMRQIDHILTMQGKIPPPSQFSRPIFLRHQRLGPTNHPVLHSGRRPPERRTEEFKTESSGQICLSLPASG